MRLRSKLKGRLGGLFDANLTLQDLPGKAFHAARGGKLQMVREGRATAGYLVKNRRESKSMGRQNSLSQLESQHSTSPQESRFKKY